MADLRPGIDVDPNAMQPWVRTALGMPAQAATPAATAGTPPTVATPLTQPVAFSRANPVRPPNIPKLASPMGGMIASANAAPSAQRAPSTPGVASGFSRATPVLPSTRAAAAAPQAPAGAAMAAPGPAPAAPPLAQTYAMPGGMPSMFASAGTPLTPDVPAHVAAAPQQHQAVDVIRAGVYGPEGDSGGGGLRYRDLTAMAPLVQPRTMPGEEAGVDMLTMARRNYVRDLALAGNDPVKHKAADDNYLGELKRQLIGGVIGYGMPGGT